MVLGGRFLQMESRGDFTGQSFESLAMIGFDRRNEVWTTVACDTVGTYWGPQTFEEPFKMEESRYTRH